MLEKKKDIVLPDGMRHMWQEVLLGLVQESQHRSLMWHEIQTPRTMNALLFPLKKHFRRHTSNSVCVLLKLIIFAVNISVKYFCFTYLISRNYLVKQHISFRSLNQNGVKNSFACCMILSFVLSTYFLILEMLLILNENFNLWGINFPCVAESKIAWFTH